MTFAQRLQLLIDQRGWTRADFAAKVGVFPGTVGRWLNEDVIPNGRALVTVARVLNVSEHHLINGGDKPKQKRYKDNVDLPIHNRKGKYIETPASELEGDPLDYYYKVISKRGGGYKKGDIVLYRRDIPVKLIRVL